MLFGYQAVYDSSWFDAIEYAAQNRFDYVSFDLNVPRFYIDSLSQSELERIRKYAEDMGVGLAFHTPGDNISLFSDYPAIRKGILEHFSAIIDAAEYLNARHVTIHPGAYPSLKQVNKTEDDFIAQYQDYFSDVLYENLLHLANRTRNVFLCIENFHFTALTRNTVDRVLSESDRLFLTWDIAKTYDKKGEIDEAVEDYMQKHIDRLREIHAHDIIKGFRSHQIIGDGSIDFQKHLEVMKHPNVAVTIEVRPREAATISRDRLVSLLHPNVIAHS